MTIEWLAGNRIRGTDAERLALGFGQSLTDSGISKSNCLAYYNFEQTSGNLINQATTSNGFADGLGSAMDGVNYGATQTATGKVDNAWSFDGTNDYVDLQRSTNIFSTNDSITMTIWVYPTASDLYLMGRRYEAMLVSNSSGVLKFAFYTVSNDQVWSATGTPITLNEWNHVAITFTYNSQNSIKMYVNGVSLSGSWDYFGNGSPGGTGNWEISKPQDYTGGSYVTGKIDEVTIWDRALSASEISTLYQDTYKINDGSIFYTTDTNKEYVLYNNAWTEV